MKNTPTEDRDFGKRYVRSQFHNLISKIKTRRISYLKIKNYLKFSDLCQAADFIEKNVGLPFQGLIFGNPLPKNYEELGVSEISSTSNNFISEINWTLISIRKYAYEINLFLIYKDQYETSLLTGEYSEAENFLTKIETEICCSLWTLENRFLIKELENKSSENKDFLSYFNEVNRSTGYTKSIAHYLSNRAEKTLSVNRFHTDLQFALARMDNERRSEHRDYYIFKLSFLNSLEFNHFSEIISYDFQHSIIDRYLNLRKVLSLLLTTANNKIKVETIQEGQIIKEYILNRINYLLRKIKDPILNKLKLFASDKLFPAFDYNQSAVEIKFIDKYTTGLYHDVENELYEYLPTNPGQFDLYILYIKSLIYQQKPFRNIGNIKSVQNQILHEMFKIVSATGNPKDAALNLLRIANNLANVVLSYGIVDFVIQKTQGKNERSLFAKLSYNAANPIINEVLLGNESKINYLNFLKSKFPTSISIDFLLSKLQDINSISKFEKLLPEAKYNVELAKGLQINKNYEKAAELWEFIKESYIDTIPIQETAIKNLFICYEELKKYDHCIILYVESYFRNAFLIHKIEVFTLLKKIRENRFRVVKPIIELPIFYTICSSDENELHTTFEMFNISKNVSRPSELLAMYDLFSHQKILFYLKLTCSLDILRHSTNINGSKVRLEERLSIIQFLKIKDSSDKDSYDAEIKYISNILVIQKGLIDLDDGKIYVNEQGILQHELKEYEAIYKRFQVIAGLMDNKKSLLVMSPGKLTQVHYTDENVESEAIKYSNNPVFDIYIEMFEAIKEKFLYSKDGIVAYLSTRIRHGVLVGEIRPVFEKYKLITKKEGDASIYRRNYYWDNIYGNTPHHIQKLQELLQNFSYSIDGLIFDLIKKYLQVYDIEKNQDGWFHYDFENEVLFWHSLKSLKTTDFPHFVQEIFEILWDKTDENLTIIRSKIQSDILLKFNEFFDKLERDLIHNLGHNTSQPIIEAIKACSTETQTVIIRISSWFKRSGTSASDFQLENVIEIVMGYADKNKRISMERSIECNSKIKGIYLKHFADLLWIFTENILKHSDEKVFKINAKITTITSNNILSIKIENEITNKQSLEALKNIWVNKQIDINKLISEGKSGYHKAYKILKYDLLDESNYLFTELNTEESVFSVNIIINLSKLLS